jgi:hypothetical protein
MTLRERAKAPTGTQSSQLDGSVPPITECRVCQIDGDVAGTKPAALSVAVLSGHMDHRHNLFVIPFVDPLALDHIESLRLA